MIIEASYEACNEAYIVEKTVEVVADIGGESQTIRIEALRDLYNGRYSTRSYKEEHVTLQPTYPQRGGRNVRQPKEFRVWVGYDLPWTDRDDADGAISQALAFLSERCDK